MVLLIFELVPFSGGYRLGYPAPFLTNLVTKALSGQWSVGLEVSKWVAFGVHNDSQKGNTGVAATNDTPTSFGTTSQTKKPGSRPFGVGLAHPNLSFHATWTISGVPPTSFGTTSQTKKPGSRPFGVEFPCTWTICGPCASASKDHVGSLKS